MRLNPIFRLYPFFVRLCGLALCILASAGTITAQESKPAKDVKNDSTFVQGISSWTYSPRGSVNNPLAVDTMPDRIHQLYPGIGSSHLIESLGQLGQPGRSMLLQNRNKTFDMPFIQAYSYYFFSHNDRIAYNTGSPYSDLYYNSTSKKQQNVGFLHTQNVNPYFNIGLRLNYFNSEGHFVNSQYAGRMISGFASYTGSVHRAFISLNYNNVIKEENGGVGKKMIRPDSVHRDTTYVNSLDELSGNYLEMPVNLNSAHSTSDYHDISILQEWNLLPGFTVLDSLLGDTDRFKLLVGQEFLYSYSARRYADVSTIADPNTFYDTIYFNKLVTSDCAIERKLSQEFFGGFNQRFTRFVTIGGRGGMGYEFNSARYRDYTFTDPKTEFNSTFYTLTFLGKIVGGYAWEATQKQYLKGEKKGDMQLDAELSKTATLFSDTVLFRAEAHSIIAKPHYFIEHYQSNNFVWDNNFNKTNTQSIFGEVSDLRKRYALSAYSAVQTNYIYFNSAALPAQCTDPITQLALSGTVYYSLRSFHFSHSFTWQTVSASNVMPVPAVVSENMAYYSTTAFNKLLYFAIGLNVDISSKYYAPKYMPATGIFYLQDEEKTGMFPYTDIFLNGKLKRMRFSFKYSQLALLTNRLANKVIVPGSATTVDSYLYGKPRFTISLAWFFRK